MSQIPSKSVQLDNTKVQGVVVGTNLGSIIYGVDLTEQRRLDLVHYLQQVANSHMMVRVAGLEAAPLKTGVRLASIYVMLAVRENYQKLYQLNEEEIVGYKEQQFVIPKESHPDFSLPNKAILAIHEDNQQFFAMRSMLAVECVEKHQYVILCGTPGSGKSTFINHLVWVLAQRGLDIINDSTTLIGWNDHRRVLPIPIDLRRLSKYLYEKPLMGSSITNGLIKWLREFYDFEQAEELIRYSLPQVGKVILFLDGLDEIPLDDTKTSINRQTMLEQIAKFAQLYPNVRIVITCRIRAWTEEYRKILQWKTYDFAPFTGGQINYFLQSWYPQLVERNMLTKTQALYYTEALITALQQPERQRLRLMATNPLLLTMMAFVMTQGELPRDRYTLYEMILKYLLGEWDMIRDGQSLSQAIGTDIITSKEIREHVLDYLSYISHIEASSSDGRGKIDKRILRDRLCEYFATLSITDPFYAAIRCIDYIEHRSGLLQPEENGTVYTFAHLTLQEHCAGRYLLLYNDVEQILRLRYDDRWREAIFLGIGCLADHPLGSSKIEQVFQALVDDRDWNGNQKLASLWYRDLMLAAELGADRDWGILHSKKINTGRLKRIISEGLVRLLEDTIHAEIALTYRQSTVRSIVPLLLKERYHSAELLSALDDPRYPKTTDEWMGHTEILSNTWTKSGQHYWRYIPAGQYSVDGWEPNTTSKLLGIAGFWLARYPITVDQYRMFIEAGGYDHDSWWTQKGLEWKNQKLRRHPQHWEYQLIQSNLNVPVVGVTWYEAAAFCKWLNTMLAAVLPVNYRINLPREELWEIAAAANPHEGRTVFPWGRNKPSPEHAIYNHSDLNKPYPVGLCILGQSACGAADMAGNVWEWTSSIYYDPEVLERNRNPSSLQMVLRGGSYMDNLMNLRCHTRDKYSPDGDFNIRGFRCAIVDANQITL